MRIPDGIQPIVGWRCWHYPVWYSEPVLHSVIQSGTWRANRALQAVCSSNHGHHAPSQHCTCGIYALSTEEGARRHAAAPKIGRVSVIGEVSLWGRVVVAENGWRAEFAYPKRLVVLGRRHTSGRTLDRIAGRLAGFGVPVAIEKQLEPEPVGWRDDWVRRLLIVILNFLLVVGIATAILIHSLQIAAVVALLWSIGPSVIMAGLGAIRKRRRESPPTTASQTP